VATSCSALGFNATHAAATTPLTASAVIRATVPVARHRLATEQFDRDLALARSNGERVAYAQHCDQSRLARIGREKRSSKAPMAAKAEQAPERQQARFRRADTVEEVLQRDRLLTVEPACRDIKAQVMTAIGEHGVLAPIGADNDRQPRRQASKRYRVCIAHLGWRGTHRKSRGIERGIPDDPRFEGSPLRVLGERGSPSGPPRRRASPCWRACTRRHRPGRAAAIPTSTRRDPRR
jgi:hypothetical protein